MKALQSLPPVAVQPPSVGHHRISKPPSLNEHLICPILLLPFLHPSVPQSFRKIQTVQSDCDRCLEMRPNT